MSRFSMTLLGLAFLAILLAAVPSAQEDNAGTLLVANKSDNSLYFVRPSSLLITDSVATGHEPHEVAVAPKRKRAYVANYGDGTISVVDVEAQSAVERWSLEGHDRPHGIAVGPAEHHVYVTAETNQAVLELDATTGEVVRKFETGKETTHMLALSSDGRFLYATSIGSGTLSVVQLDTGQVLSHLPTGEGAEGLAVTPDDNHIWVTNRAEDSVSIVSANASEVVESLEVTGFPIRVDVASHGERAIVSSARGGHVTVFDANTYEALSRLETGRLPIGVMIAPSGTRAFVANAGSNTVSTINLETLSIENTASMGREPDGMAFVPGS